MTVGHQKKVFPLGTLTNRTFILGMLSAGSRGMDPMTVVFPLEDKKKSSRVSISYKKQQEAEQVGSPSPA